MTDCVKHRLFEEASSNRGSGGSLTPTNITYAALLTLYNAGTMVPGWYNITDRANAGIIIEAVTTSRLALNATGLFLNADYQSVGNYSDVPTVGAKLGIWWSGLTPSIGDMVIYSGNHYRNKRGLVGSAPGSYGGAADWLLFPKTIAENYGYILEADYIEYDFVSDTFIRLDKRNNRIWITGSPSFQWGFDGCRDNTATSYNTINNINQRGANFFGNTVINQGQLLTDNTNVGDITNNIIDGLGAGAPLTAQFPTGTLNGCTIRYSSVVSFVDMSYIGLTFNKLQSDFPATIDITGLTTLDITAGLNYIGIVNLTSSNAAETINLFSNFPASQSLKFYPPAGLTVTFVSNTGANQPRCSGGVNAVLNGNNGDYIELTLMPDGFIYQTRGETY